MTAGHMAQGLEVAAASGQAEVGLVPLKCLALALRPCHRATASPPTWLLLEGPAHCMHGRLQVHIEAVHLCAALQLSSSS